MYSEVRCKRCRSRIFGDNECESLFLSAHSVVLDNLNDSECNVENVVFLNEDYVPQWIKDRIAEENWSKGRINCPQCDSRIGAFNFVAGQKCNCSNFVLPFVHIIKSKVDLVKL